MIIDDEMHAVMVKPLPAGCRLTAIYDCEQAHVMLWLCRIDDSFSTLACHSGTALDLPYVVSDNERANHVLMHPVTDEHLWDHS
jgi:hypothetical protein